MYFGVECTNLVSSGEQVDMIAREMEESFSGLYLQLSQMGPRLTEGIGNVQEARPARECRTPETRGQFGGSQGHRLPTFRE